MNVSLIIIPSCLYFLETEDQLKSTGNSNIVCIEVDKTGEKESTADVCEWNG